MTDAALDLLGGAQLVRTRASDIRDEWSDSRVPITWESAEEWVAAIRTEAAEVRMDRQAGPMTRLVVLCEAAGMVPQIAAAVEQWTIPVYSSGGFDRTPTRHDFARKIASSDRPAASQSSRRRRSRLRAQDERDGVTD